MDGPSRRPTDSSRSAGTPSLGEVPSVGAKAFCLLFGWAGIPAFQKVSRCKSGTLSGRYLTNGYVLNSTPPPTTGSCKKFPIRVQMYSMTALTPRRTAILTFIRDRMAQQGQPPSLAEIARGVGLASRSVARKHVVALTEAGFVEVNPNQARGIRLLNQPMRPEWLDVPGARPSRRRPAHRC